MNSSEMLDYANEMYLTYNPKEPPYNDEGGIDPLSDRKEKMTNNMVWSNENKAKAILGRIENCRKINPKLKGFRVTAEKNDRGDYGKTEKYYYNMVLFLVISFDGARQDTHYYTTFNTQSVLEQMEQDAKEKL